MNSQEKYIIQRKTQVKYNFYRIGTGLKEIVSKRYAKIIIAIYFIAVILAGFYILGRSNQNMDIFDVIYMGSLRLLYPPLVIITGAFILMRLGTPIGATTTNENLWRIGLTNHAGEAPLLLRKHKEPNSEITIMEFVPNGIPRTEWEDKQDKIETALDIYIIKIEEGKNKKRLILHTVTGDCKLPKFMYWQEKYLSNNDFKLVLGQSMLGKITVNLAKIPHILLGGSTGSGKSVLLKLLIMQCVKKDADVYIADFKGGVDFSPVWHTKCKIIIDENNLLNILTEIVDELENRKTLLRESGCANIGEYNERYGKQLKRIIFACDEVAEVLYKTGLSKEAKEIVTKIEGKLSVIARQGRAFGIHLILATQRPDANILTGQIRNNIDYRVCGRADNVLSQIILDNTEAADSIPKDSQGLFITHDKTIFQGFLFDEKTVFNE
jgi:S-DNA-T family DNA segregation ATPase FtsK/SpoIIIE